MPWAWHWWIPPIGTQGSLLTSHPDHLRGSATLPRPTAPTRVHTRLVLQHTEAQAPPWWLGRVLAVGGSLVPSCYSPISPGEANVIAWELGMWSETASEPTGAQRGRCGRDLRSHHLRPLRTDHHFRMVIVAHLDTPILYLQPPLTVGQL